MMVKYDGKVRQCPNAPPFSIHCLSHAVPGYGTIGRYGRYGRYYE